MDQNFLENFGQEKPDDSMDAKGFVFLPSYLESYEIFKNEVGEELANKLLQAIVYYGIKGVEMKTDYRVSAVMVSIKATIDKAKKNYKKKLE